jgi:hypothetical protein
MLIPRGDYLSPEEYRKMIGFETTKPVFSALKEGRLQGINFYGHWLILRNAIIIDKRIKTGKYIGLSRQKRIRKALADKLFADENDIDI